MEPIFKSLELQERFNQDGYVRIPVLNSEQIERLKQMYLGYKDSLMFHGGIHITAEMSTPEQRQEIGKAVTDFLKPSLDNVFQNHDSLHGSFLVKTANTSSNQIGVHQDWTFVPENLGYSSGTLWIAVNDIPKERGGIGFIPGSHKWSDHTRYTPHEVAYNPFYEHGEMIMDKLSFLELKAGEAVLWNHKTLHGSVGNSTDEDRLVAGLSILPKDADKQIHFQIPNGNGEVSILKVDEGFYGRHNSTSLHGHFKDGTFPEGLEPVETYQPFMKKFSAENLAKALDRVDYQQVVQADLLAEEFTEEHSSEGFFARMKRAVLGS